MNKPLIVLLSISFFFTFANYASSAPIYKCKDSKGKILYSESPCPSKYVGNEIGVSDNVTEASGLRQHLQAQEIYSSPQITNPNTVITNSQNNANLMSDHDRKNRIQQTNVDSKSSSASEEKKYDAQYEHDILNGQSANQLSQDDEVKRKNFKVDLDSADQNKRQNAANQLRNIYQKYRN